MIDIVIMYTEGVGMALSKRSIEILIDLLEVRINVLMITDQEDVRELNRLRKCKEELENVLMVVAHRA